LARPAHHRRRETRARGLRRRGATAAARPVRLMPFSFRVEARAARARAGRFETPHGAVATPAFMPVGTRASVKGVRPDELRALGTQMVLANTYHLSLRPGAELVR